MDLNSILLMLNGLGPWGILLGAVLTIGVQWLRNRNPVPLPTPDPNSPLPTPSKTPILDALLNLLKLKLLKQEAPAKFEAGVVESKGADEEAAEKLLKLLSDKK